MSRFFFSLLFFIGKYKSLFSHDFRSERFLIQLTDQNPLEYCRYFSTNHPANSCRICPLGLHCWNSVSCRSNRIWNSLELFYFPGSSENHQSDLNSLILENSAYFTIGRFNGIVRTCNLVLRSSYNNFRSRSK
jgi:hypothetical protein